MKLWCLEVKISSLIILISSAELALFQLGEGDWGWDLLIFPKYTPGTLWANKNLCKKNHFLGKIHWIGHQPRWKSVKICQTFNLSVNIICPYHTPSHLPYNIDYRPQTSNPCMHIMKCTLIFKMEEHTIVVFLPINPESWFDRNVNHFIKLELKTGKLSFCIKVSYNSSTLPTKLNYTVN